MEESCQQISTRDNLPNIGLETGANFKIVKSSHCSHYRFTYQTNCWDTKKLFQLDQNKVRYYSKFEGLEFHRQMIVLWPKKKTFDIALAFGVDEALDMIEKDAVAETKEAEMKALIEHCKEHPCETWLPNNRDGCEVLRCVSERHNPIKLGSKRALRIINLCLKWKLKSCGLELINVLFKTDFDWDLFGCWDCVINCISIKQPFVGGVCSKDVASQLAELIVMVGWNSIANISQFHTGKHFDFKQIGHLSHLAVCLANLNCLEGAKIVRNEVFEILKIEEYLKKLTKLEDASGTFGSCIAMIALVDGLSSPEDGRLDNLLAHLNFNGEKSLKIIGWISEMDATLIDSLSHLDYYTELLANFECQMNPPRFAESFTAQEVAAAQLMSSYFKLQDKLTLIGGITGSKMLFSSVLCTRTAWTSSSSLVDATLAQLVASRVQRLFQFKTSLFSLENPVIPKYQAVDRFLHSDENCMTYDNSFANEEEGLNFVSKYFSRRLAGTGDCMADCEVVKTFVDGESNEKICVVIKTNWDSSNLHSSHKRPSDSSCGRGQKKLENSDSV